MFIEIQTELDLQSAVDESPTETVVFFKHSTRCPISHRAYQELLILEIPVHLISVIENRDVSNQLVTICGVRHESPQVVIVHNKKVIWHASHYAITAREIRSQLKKLTL